MTVARHLRHTSEKSRFRFAGTTALSGRCLYNGKQREAADREATDPHHGFGTRTITLRPGKQRGATGSNGSGSNGPAAPIWDPVDHLPAREAKRSKGKQRIRTTNLGLGVPLVGSGSNGNQREATDREATYPHHGFVTQWTNYHPRVL